MTKNKRTNYNRLLRPLAREVSDFVGDDGKSHTLTLIIGRPFKVGELQGKAVWRCPYAYGIDGRLYEGSLGGPGKADCLINVGVRLNSERAQLIDEPAFARAERERLEKVRKQHEQLTGHVPRTARRRQIPRKGG